MTFIQYLFSFLYVRNWHTGRYEMSALRAVLFCAGLFLLVLALLIVSYLQAPAEFLPVL